MVGFAGFGVWGSLALTDRCLRSDVQSMTFGPPPPPPSPGDVRYLARSIIGLKEPSTAAHVHGEPHVRPRMPKRLQEPSGNATAAHFAKRAKTLSMMTVRALRDSRFCGISTIFWVMCVCVCVWCVFVCVCVCVCVCVGG